MTRHELKELEHDPLAAKVGTALQYTTAHKSQVVRLGIGVLLALVLAGAGYWYWSNAKTQRQADLRAAFEVSEGGVGTQVSPFGKNFPTKQAKDEATLKAFSEVAAKHSGTKEGDVAAFYVAVLQNEKGNTNIALTTLKGIVDDGGPMAAVAKLSLADLYAGQGKYLDAENLVKTLVDRPADLVSKEQAQIALAQILSKHDPDAAKKLLESIKPATTSIDGASWQRSIDQARAAIDQR